MHYLLLILILLTGYSFDLIAQSNMSYTVSIPNIHKQYLHVELTCNRWHHDTLNLKMPNWSPGYYQMLNYSNAVENILLTSHKKKSVSIRQMNSNTWQVIGCKNSSFHLSYDIKADKHFVAQPYANQDYVYILPCGVFFYPEGFLNTPVTLTVESKAGWKIATGLSSIKTNVLSAADFDILYDSPILIGNLESLPTFTVNNIPHHFIGYKLGTFDKSGFINNLQKVVTSAADIIGDIPYSQYTFIGIGAGQGGIEHLNSTTISFDGTDVQSKDGMERMLNFLAHEYFHHYNVKRIRPFELGPFDYENGSKTNLLWVSEGFTVYYEYLIIKRAGLSSENELLNNLAENITGTENDEGIHYQSLASASFETWHDGPFGQQGGEKDRSISIYHKGAVAGLLFDFAIRHVTENKKSLDDVMRMLYQKYYKQQQRGFTDAEFRSVCESIAGTSLNELFDYVYTTKEIDYNLYLGFAGLKIEKAEATKHKYIITRIEKPNDLQSRILNSWLGE